MARRKMRILLASSEVTPLARTGGLGDVAGALPAALRSLRHDVAVVMPFYGLIDREAHPAELLIPAIRVHLPAGDRDLAVWRATLPGTENSRRPVPVYLIDDPGLFDRPNLYQENGKDYPDNALRFAYFCLATLWMLKALDWIPDIIHCNDWQTALIPIYLKDYDSLRNDPDLGGMSTLFAIHNVLYQGVFPSYVLPSLGLPQEAYDAHRIEYHGYLNLMKGAILYSGGLSTVSRAYAKEIQTPEFGYGMEGLLRGRAADLTGILNGIDTERWNPATDPALPAHYDRERMEGKAVCKRELQKRFGLRRVANRPLIGMIGRLTDQKGLDILAEALPELLRGHIQFVLLGTGQPEYHALFKHLAEQFPRKVGLTLDFDDELAHQIEAGADMFLMPSRFEPCGLNQLYSLRYGTVPIVRRTGGLSDSIVNTRKSTLANGRATGFVFTPYSARSLLHTTRRALRFYRRDKETWARIVANGMAKDFSWRRSAFAYLRKYRRILKGGIHE